MMEMHRDFVAQVSDLVRQQVQRYPRMQAIDLYKVIHQMVQGPSHAIFAPREAYELLVEEAADLDLHVREWEDAVEMLDGTRGLARIHLRPYLRAGGDLIRLYHAFGKTAKRIRADIEKLEIVLGLVIGILEDDCQHFAFTVDDFREVVSEAADAGYPAASHSGTYEAIYEPAYRVVLLDEF